MNGGVERASARLAPVKLADGAYVQLKKDLFDARLVPGERFSEADVAARLGISRTPVREALFRLQREGYLDVTARSGWVVTPLDRESLDHLYELRVVLETIAVTRLCDRDPAANATLDALRAAWPVEHASRSIDERCLAERDEAFCTALVAAAGNPEIARVHREVTERMRIVRRLDGAPRPAAVADRAHGMILAAIVARRGDEAVRLLRAHVEADKADVLARRRAPRTAL